MKKKNVFILILEKGANSPNGISFDEALSYLNELGFDIDEDFELALSHWFFQNFIHIKKSFIRSG